MPMTCTGLALVVVELSPSSPSKLLPQHSAAPEGMIAQKLAWSLSTLIADTPFNTGVALHGKLEPHVCGPTVVPMPRAPS